MQQNYIDILLVSESHFTDKSYFHIPRYITYHTNHPDKTAHAGTAILIKEAISHHDMMKYETDFLQATVIKIKSLPYKLTVASVYCPPRHNIKREHFKDFFLTLGPKFISGGDYNSKNTLWGSRLSTTKGRELAHLLQEQNYSFLSTSTPTYWPTDSNKVPDLLDFFITNGISADYMDVVPSYDLSSDHSPIILTVSRFNIHNRTKSKLHNKNTDWKQYRNNVHDALVLNTSLKNPNEIDDAISTLTTILTRAAQQATPQIGQQKQTNTLPLEIKKLIAVKRKARSKWQRSHAPSDKTALNQAVNHLKIKMAKDRSFHDYITKLNGFDNSIWIPIRHTKKPKHLPPIRNALSSSSPWARSDNEKTTVFANHLAKTFTPNDDNTDVEIERDLDHIPGNVPPIKPATPKETQKEINRLNPKKAPGMDQITPMMVKQLPKKGILFLTYIFNAILRLKYWPKQLKAAEIILIPKAGKDLTEPSSYRPISLLSVLAKLYERLLRDRIYSDPCAADWIPSHQFGFRARHSTVQQIHRISYAINSALENKEYCPSVFLDVSQAFDKVWHAGLLYKIKQQLPIAYYQLLQSYLRDRVFRTKVNATTSDLFPIRAGVPQGSVLGPFLYLLYTSDLPTSLNVTTGTFADDTVILTSNVNPIEASNTLQTHLNRIQAWTQKWKIKINETKSAQVNFTLKKGKCPTLYWRRVEILTAASNKYLGMHMDSKLSWADHILKKKKQMELKITQLYWLIGRRSKLSLENKLLIYKTIIKPIWTYGIELWGCASKSHVALIQRSQSKILRMITDAPWFVSNQTLHDDLKVPFVTEVIKTNSLKHNQQLTVHPNTLLHSIIGTPPNYRRLKRIWPTDLKN